MPNAQEAGAPGCSGRAAVQHHRNRQELRAAGVQVADGLPKQIPDRPSGRPRRSVHRAVQQVFEILSRVLMYTFLSSALSFLSSLVRPLCRIVGRLIEVNTWLTCIMTLGPALMFLGTAWSILELCDFLAVVTTSLAATCHLPENRSISAQNLYPRAGLVQKPRSTGTCGRKQYC